MAGYSPIGTRDVSCEDFLAFQEVINKSRGIDDQIVYALNKSIPTQSFSEEVVITDTCRTLYSKLEDNYSNREAAIRRCIQTTSGIVDRLREHILQDSDDRHLMKKLRQEQLKVRLYRSELDVEEVVRDRSLKSMRERCRLFYTPEQSQRN